jgi:hypothetical protein
MKRLLVLSLRDTQLPLTDSLSLNPISLTYESALSGKSAGLAKEIEIGSSLVLLKVLFRGMN